MLPPHVHTLKEHLPINSPKKPSRITRFLVQCGHLLLFIAILEGIVFYPNLYELDLLLILGGLLGISLFLALKDTLLHSKNAKAFALPFFFTFSTGLLLYLIDSFLERQIFIIIAALIYILILLSSSKSALKKMNRAHKGLISSSMIATIFLFFSSFYGFYLNFVIPVWVLMSLFFIAIFFLNLFFFSLLTTNTVKIVLYSAILGLTGAQLALLVNFWPFGYLTSGVILLMMYFIVWDLAHSEFLQEISKKRVITNTTFFTLMIALILSTTQWIIQ